jgi:dihydroorotase
LQKQLADIQGQIKLEQERNLIGNRMQSIRKTLTEFKETWEYMTRQEQKNVVRNCVGKIVITDNQAEIFYKFDDFAEKALDKQILHIGHSFQ